MHLRPYLINLLCLCFFGNLSGQIDTILFAETASLEFPAPGPFQLKSSFTTCFDKIDRPYLYSANMESGLGIYDISQSGLIETVADLDTSFFEGLDVSNLTQRGELLFLALGDFQAINPSSGLAIVDVSEPTSPMVTDIWTSSDFVNGVSHLLIDGDYAYLSMMNDGLLILNISDPNAIIYESDMVPDLDYPEPSADHHQGRGLDFRNDTLFYAFDRGGLRLIDVSNKNAPLEIGQYINTDLNDQAGAAYNDVLIIDNYAFVSLDYCGLEVLDISTQPISLVDWYNPWECSFFNWNGADLHLNELITSDDNDLLFISGGNSELIVFDISQPQNSRQIGQFYELDNELAAYGLDVRGDQVCLSYVNNPFNIPFVGNWGGLKTLEITEIVATFEEAIPPPITFYPNPVLDHIQIDIKDIILRLEVYNFEGRLVKTNFKSNIIENRVDVSDLSSGVYYIKVLTDQKYFVRKFIKI